MPASTPDDDFETWRRSADPEAIARLFDLAAPKLLLLASHWTRDPAAAEDLVQLTFVHAVRDAAAWNPQQPVLRWLAGILAHRAIDLRRAGSRRPAEALPPDAVQHREPDPARAAIEREAWLEVQQAVERLPDQYRDALLLRLLHGLTSVQIAHALGRSPSAVRKQLERGLARLRLSLPAGLAGLVAARLEASAGLGAMRAAVVRAVAPAQPAAASPLSWILGGIVISKSVAAIAAIVIAAAAALWLLPGTGNRIGTHADPVSPETLDDAARATAAGRTESVQAQLGNGEAPGAERIEATAELGWLLVHAVEQDSATPVPGAGFFYSCFDPADVQRLHRSTARADASGRLRLGPFGAGYVLLDCARGGQGKGEITPGATNEVTIELPEPRRLTGRVLHADGSPAARARLFQSNEVRAHPLIEAGGSDSDGRFELFVDPKRPFLLGAELDGFVRSRMCGINMPREPRELVLRLGTSSVPRRVLVQDDAGRPIGGAFLFVGRERLGSGRPDHEPHGRALLTGSDGIATLRDLELSFPTLARVVVRADGFALLRNDVAWQAAGDAPVVLTLHRAPIVRGIVHDASTGRPARRGTILLHGEYGAVDSIYTRTAEDGSFELHGLPVGQVSLLAALDARTGEPPLQAKRVLALRPGETTVWNPVLATPAVRIGLVVDRDGAPVAGASVRIHCAGGNGDEVATSASGQFRLERDPGDRSIRIEVRLGSGDGVVPRAVRTIPAPVAWPIDAIVIDTRPASACEWQLDSGGLPPERVGLELVAEVEPGTPIELRPRPKAPGRWRLERLPPGRYRVELWRDRTDGVRRQLLARRVFELPGAAADRHERIELRADASGATSCSSVLDDGSRQDWRLASNR